MRNKEDMKKPKNCESDKETMEIMEMPSPVLEIIENLQNNGFEAYVVGGCVRDILINRIPNDWDITTNALPEEIQKIFPDSFYENKFGTVAIKATRGLTRTETRTNAELTRTETRTNAHITRGLTQTETRTNAELTQTETRTNAHITREVVEVTTFRTEAKYTDKRHPDEVKFAKNIEDDLKRRDFTINAMAMKVQSSKLKVKSFEIVDLFGGQEDLKNKIIRAVGNPEERFGEDALRMLRAVRFANELNFAIEEKTAEAITKNAFLLEAIAKERIKDEFIKIIESPTPAFGIELLRKLGLLKFIIPELESGFGVSQNKYHIYDIYEHSLHSLKAAAEQNFNLSVRISALLHDIAKPKTKEGEGPDATFYNHDYVGAKICARIFSRLKFPKKESEKIILLVKNHMFLSDPDKITDAGVRRLIRRVGPENIKDLINLRISDRLGMKIQYVPRVPRTDADLTRTNAEIKRTDADLTRTNAEIERTNTELYGGFRTRTPKARPYRLRSLEYLIEKVQKDPISAKMLKINGNDIMEELKIESGPKIGAILNILLAEVIEEPEKNEREYLVKRIKELNKENLEKLKEKAKEKIEEKKEEEDLKIRGKYWIK